MEVRPGSRLLFFLALALAGCIGEEGSSTTESPLIVTSSCELGGSGTLAGGDVMSGDVVGSPAAGSWSHTLGGDAFSGTPTSITCRINGSTLADVTGTGTYDGAPGYSFTLHVQDRGDGTPTRVPAAAEIRTLAATRTYSPSRWTDGTLDFADGALVTVPESLPVTVGNGGNQWTHLTFVDHDSGEPIRCMYRGGAAHPNPTSPGDVALGLAYHFARCERLHCEASSGSSPGSRGGHGHECSNGPDCSYETDPGIVPGTVLDVDSIELHVQSGSSRYPSRAEARTTVSIDLSVTTFSVREPEPDYYRFLVFDPAGALVMLADGDLTSGDLSIVRLP